MVARIDNIVTSWTFSLDGGTWDVDNNVWIVGDDAEVMLWDAVHDGAPDREITDGDRFEVAGTTLVAPHTPGHSPGSTSFYAEDLGVVFTGDTLFNGGPGATGRSYSDYPTIVKSIRDRLLTLPEKTVVKTGHGDDTSVAAEKPSLPAWKAKV